MSTLILFLFECMTRLMRLMIVMQIEIPIKNCDGGSAMLGMVKDGDFLELSFPSTSSGSCAGQVRPINTVFIFPLNKYHNLKVLGN